MCSRIQVKLGGSTRTVMPGDQIPYRHEDKLWAGMWGTNFGSQLIGFARVETIREKWLPKHWQPCTVSVSNFAEGHQRVTWAGVKGELAALVRGSEVVIITRDATPAEEQALNHHRVPVCVVRNQMVLPSKGGAAWF